MKSLSTNSILILVFYTITIALAYTAINSWIVSLTPEHSLTSIDGQHVGRDFIFFYAAAKEAIIGNAHSLYTQYFTPETTSTLIPELGNTKLDEWVWMYPPHYLLLLAPLGFLPYYFALATWLIASILLPVITLRYFWQMNFGWLFFVLLNINVFCCLIMGQNALILSSIAGIGIASIKKNPLLAGICFSIVSMKPHFAILIPVALILGKYWQALLYTIISTFIMMIISSALFGWNIYFLAAEHFSAIQNYTLSGDSWFLSIYSTHRALLNIGFSSIYAWAGYFLIAVIALYAFGNIWRKNYPLSSKWLAFGIAALLCTPYNLAYDAIWILLPVMVWLYNLLKNNKEQTNSIIYSLLALQIFAFAIISISETFAIIVILGALAIILKITSKQYVQDI